jgi:hypothetical protein
MNMRWLFAFVAFVATLGPYSSIVLASECPGGELTITPSGVLALSTPVTFSISFDSSGSANFPNILLVMTKTSYESLTGPIIVNWTGGSASFVKANFQAVDSGYIPSVAVTSYDSGRYGLLELREQLEVNDTANDALYYVFGSFLSGAVGQTVQTFNVTLPSENPRMLVLAIARTYCSTSFDIRTFLTCETIPEFDAVFPALVLGALGFCLISTHFVSRTRRRANRTNPNA